MTKTDWFHIFLFLHMAGLASVLLLPITGFVLRNELRSRDFAVSSKLAMFFTRVDIAALTGVTLLFLSGMGEMWVHGIAVKDLSGDTKWLGVKVILFVCVLLILAFASPSIFSIYRITRGLGEPAAQPSIAESPVTPAVGGVAPAVALAGPPPGRGGEPKGNDTGPQAALLDAELKSNYSRLYVAVPSLAVLLIAIIVLVTFQPSF
jgi:hypothetical protein